MEKEPWEDIEIELLGVVGAIQSDELIQRFSKSVLKAREAYLNARREGVEAAIEAIKPWLIGLDSVPWEDEVEEKLSDVRSELLNK